MLNTNYISPESVQRAKAISIEALLQSLGHRPTKEVGKELVYCSPLRNEQTPSFFVNPSKNRFTDFGGTEEMKGDIINLARLLWSVSFKEAVERLLSMTGIVPFTFSFGSNPLKEDTTKGIEITSVRTLQHFALTQFAGQRGISLNLAKRFLKEVYYQTKGKSYFALGFLNDSGGYELRNGLNFKGKTSNDITTFDKGSESVILYEGFFDFLSALQYKGIQEPTTTTIVLNTCNNLTRALPLLANSQQIHCFLDNDETGRKTVQKLINMGFDVINRSSLLYPNHKDFNDFLIAYRNEEATK